jgi:NAD(P)H-hydrate repair Nnr-like enzyme with NAD(P)H-hydrate dehydratase domain
MVRPWRGERVTDDACTAMVMGPGLAADGLSPALRQEVQRLWVEAPQAVVADATALDWLPREIRKEAGVRVITPHPGEGRALARRHPCGDPGGSGWARPGGWRASGVAAMSGWC